MTELRKLYGSTLPHRCLSASFSTTNNKRALLKKVLQEKAGKLRSLKSGRAAQQMSSQPVFKQFTDEEKARRKRAVLEKLRAKTGKRAVVKPKSKAKAKAKSKSKSTGASKKSRASVKKQARSKGLASKVQNATINLNECLNSNGHVSATKAFMRFVGRFSKDRKLSDIQKVLRSDLATFAHAEATNARVTADKVIFDHESIDLYVDAIFHMRREELFRRHRNRYCNLLADELIREAAFEEVEEI